MTLLIRCALFGIATIVPNLNAATSDLSLTIIAGGETHAMLHPCDCPKDPGGGLAQRAHFLKKQQTSQAALLLDAGGFSGGGIYDAYTEGRKNDSVRTLKTLAAMGIMAYDAVTIGDDDLQYGANWLCESAARNGVPLVSANVIARDSKPLVATYVLVKRNKWTFAITGVTSSERLFPIDNSVRVKEPVAAIRSIWKEMVAKSDFQIILSHLGQESTLALLDSFPECELAVNGHRKTGSEPLLMRGTTPVLQFGFQGKTLSYASVRIRGKHLEATKSGWFEIREDFPEDSAVAALLAASVPTHSATVYDLYIMSQCPYGLEALGTMMQFAGKFLSIEWNIWFIGTVGSDSILKSLHGTEEIEDEKVWLAIKMLYPDRWFQFLQMRSSSPASTVSLVKKLGFDEPAINRWVKSDGNSRLSSHYERSRRLEVSASPTLHVNNVPSEKAILFERLAKSECGRADNRVALCDSLPECFEDTDCKMTGKLGRCIKETGKCEYRDAVNFNFTALIADSTIQHPENAVITTTIEIFPGAKIKKVLLSSNEGREITAKFKPAALPFYIFGREIKQAHNYSSVESGLTETGHGLVFRASAVRHNYFLNRKPIPHKIDLIVDPFFSNIDKVLGCVARDSLLRAQVNILPVIYSDPLVMVSGNEERLRREEALRWLILGGAGKMKLMSYLDNYSSNPGSSYWFGFLNSTGFTPDSIEGLAVRKAGLLSEHWRVLESFSIREPVVLIIGNRELIGISSERELAAILAESRLPRPYGNPVGQRRMPGRAVGNRPR